jgi:hypothetical protein
MSSKLIKLLYNPCSLTTTLGYDFQSYDDFSENAENDDAKLPESSMKVLDILENLIHSPVSAHEMKHGLRSLKNYHLENLSLDARPTIMKELSRVMQKLRAEFGGEIELFRTAMQVVSLFKALIDLRPNAKTHDANQEWVSLEACVYQLSEWENRSKTVWENYH